MFDFDNDGVFDLDDIIEADIKFGLFSDRECSHCGKYIVCIESTLCPFCGEKLDLN